ncbi:MAG TPA: hypothetical protein ENN08_03635 [Bacteroidales bacterium]|nr:hypothetical protein [Bacteroidales bacterium]
MKKIITLILIACTAFMSLSAQDVSSQLGEARKYYGDGDLQSARFALQQAMNEIDLAIGREILKLLPQKMGEMPVIENNDEYNATSLGFAGIYVNRYYGNMEDKHASIQLITDSPMLTGVNAILSLPMIGMGDPNQKRIRIGNYRGLMQKSTDESGIVSWDVQIPFGASLLTFQCVGIGDEKTVTNMANTIPVDAMAKLVQ